MTKLLFMPVRLVAGLLAGLIGKRAFDLIWGLIDEQVPPRPESRQANVGKLALALTLEGALLRAIKGLIDHASRRGFASLTGAWPGDED